MLMAETKDELVKADCQEILDAMLERKKFVRNAQISAKENRASQAQYWFGRDYAMCFLIRGSYSIMTARINGEIPDLKEFN